MTTANTFQRRAGIAAAGVLFAFSALASGTEAPPVEAAPPAAAVACAQCGMIESVRELKQEGERVRFGNGGMVRSGQEALRMAGRDGVSI